MRSGWVGRSIRVAASSLLVLAAACGHAVPQARGHGSGSSGPTATGATGAPPTGTVRLRDFATASFGDPADVDNQWLPMVPGRQLVWRGHAFDGQDRVGRMVVLTATDMTKVIAGVRTRVVQELDFDDGVLGERELVFLAQDDDGNVWQVGEFPEEVEDGEITKTPMWIHGAHGARAGVMMKAVPIVGTPSYAEGWGPQFGWNDRGETFAVDTRTCSAIACYTGVMVVREYNPDEANAAQLKYYAPGVGGVRVGWRGSAEEEREELALVSITRLGPGELADLDREVLAQDARGYEAMPDVYGTTEPIQPSA